MSACFYLPRLKSGRLCPGATTDLEKRWRDHVAGKGGRTTRLDPPVAMVYREQFSTFAEARQREAQVKRWSGRKKEALVRGDEATLHRLAVSHD